MYPDHKTIRRRRAVLAVLVFGCIVLLTASFGGDAASGPLGSIQRGVFEIVSPIQDGASRALSPIRNGINWIGDTWHAKGDNDQLRADNDRMRAQLARASGMLRDDADLRSQAKLGAKWGADRLDPVTARISGASPTLFQQTVNINRGRGSGIRLDQPVTGRGYLVGKVSFVAGGYAQFTSITDESFQVAAITDGSHGADAAVAGVIQAANGNPRDLVMRFTQGGVVKRGEMVMTKGTDKRAGAEPDLYPADIPIGRVSRVDQAATDAQLVHVTPFVNPRDLTYVQVLTRTPAAADS